MSTKPSTVAGYPPEFEDLVQSTCLYLATRLGDLDDDLVVVGGLVPTLLIPRQSLPIGTAQHVGTRDLDMGLELGMLDEARYIALVDQLLEAGFEPSRNDKDNIQPQTWTIDGAHEVTVDFLISPPSPRERPGRVFHLQGGKLGAFVTPGLGLNPAAVEGFIRNQARHVRTVRFLMSARASE